MNTLKQEITSAINNECKTEGFKKKGYFYYRETDRENFHDLINFSHYYWYSMRGISVYPGIRHTIIEELHAKFTNNHNNKPLALLTLNLGNLEPMKRFKQWDVIRDATPDEVKRIVDDIFQEIREFAYPFFKKYEDIDLLIKAFEQRSLHIDVDRQFYILPQLYLLKNQKDKGMDFINKKIQEGFVRIDYQRNFISNYLNYEDTPI